MFLPLKHWKTQLNILWLGQVILLSMLAMSQPYWPLYIAQLGHYTPSQIRFWSAAIYIAPFASSIVSSPIWGMVGDKFGYKPMVIRAALGIFVTQTLILFFTDVTLIFIFKLLQGLLAGFVVAAQTWALSISPTEERGATLGKLQSANAVGNLFGPLLGGIIATFGGYHSIFTGSSIISAVVTLFFMLLLYNPPVKAIQEAAMMPEKKSSFLSSIHAAAFSLLTVIIVMQLARAMVTPVFSLFVAEKLNGSDMTIGLLFAATGLMIFVTAPYWGKYFDKQMNAGKNIYPTVVLLLIFCGLLQVLHAYAYTSVQVFSLRLLWGVGLGALLPILLKLLVDNSDSHQHGFYLGLGGSAAKLGNLFGIMLGALIEANFGYTNSFLLNGVLYLAVAILICWQFKPFKTPQDVRLSHEKS